MPYFSERSKERLASCHRDLQRLFNAVCWMRDCTILEGYRDDTRQKTLFNEGKSQVRSSMHNLTPSRAVDVAPWPIPDWNDKQSFIHFGGYVRGVADMMNIPVRWGGDWDNDNELNDQNFNDLLHFELIEEA